MKAIHNIQPIYNEESKILILGSMPSVTSREKEFFYAHPQNRFWPVLETIFEVNLPTINAKKEFLLQEKIALWDTIKSCHINGSSDASIKDIEVNDIEMILNKAQIKAIFCTGKTSYNLFTKYFKVNIPVYCLPSPSSANATYSLAKLVESYKIILTYLTK